MTQKNGTTIDKMKNTTTPYRASESVGSAVIELLADDESGRWDEFVGSHVTATLYHKSVWRGLIKQVFGHEAHYLCAKSATGELIGTLPLVRLKSRLFGDFMVSMPYFNYGGAVATRVEIEEALMKKACVLAQDLGVEHIEFRDVAHRPDNWSSRMDKVTMELTLPDSTEALWSQLGPKLRAQIKRPAKEDVEVIRGGRDLLPQFYQVFSRNMRDLGTPVYPEEFFASILETLCDSAFLTIIRHSRKPVAAAFLLGYRHRMEIPWASSVREFNRMGVNMLLYWEVLKYAIEGEYRVFDFGRSSIDSGTHRFKKQWGGKEKQLYWYYWVRPGHEMPRLTHDNPRYKLAVETWKRLPLFLANRVGPKIVKNLP